MPLIYLATPYSHSDPDVKQRRFDAVNRAAASLMRRGCHVYSPISHSHPIALAGDLPGDWEYWERYDREILRMCARVIVLRQDGWRESTGVTAEIEIAAELGLPVAFMDPEPPA